MTDDSISFSVREGFVKVSQHLQTDSMSIQLRNGIWNVIWLTYWPDFQPHKLGSIEYMNNHPQMKSFVIDLWKNFYKATLDTIPDSTNTLFDQLKKNFQGCLWYNAYDFIEFLSKKYDSTNKQLYEKFEKNCNEILKKESSGYRLVSKNIVKITSEEELIELSKAITSPLKSVNEHLIRALELLSDRQNSDPRNSIKESISAVESICQKITGKNTATLGDALNMIRDKKPIELHPALRDSFNKLYGYTSSADGIRHALLEESNLSEDDARFMLISCSAFVNYLISKSIESGIDLK